MSIAFADGQALSEETAALAKLADLGEIMVPVTHECNNFLNGLLLRMATLEWQVPELRSEIVEIRQEGKQLTALLSQLQRYRQDCRPQPRPINLNEVVRDVGEASHPGLLIELAPELPLILGAPLDLRRLCTFLMTNAVLLVSLRTESKPGKVCLHVEDTGPCVAPELLDKLFDIDCPGRSGTNALELAACKIIVQRSNGRIRATHRDEGGLTVTVEFPALARSP